MLHDLEKVVYGYVTLFVTGYMIDQVVNSSRQSVQFFIISSKYEEIGREINALHRGVTVIDGTGLYTGKQVKMMFVLAKKSQSNTIFQIISIRGLSFRKVPLSVYTGKDSIISK